MLAECALALGLETRMRAARLRVWKAVMCVLFALVTSGSPAAAAELPASCSLGPWQLGMSRAQVSDFAAFGPYTDVWETGGVETQHAPADAAPLLTAKGGTAKGGTAKGDMARPDPAQTDATGAQRAGANVSFVFDSAGLKYMLHFKYEGRDYKAAKSALLDVFDEFQRNYGGATLEDFTVQGPAAGAQFDHQVLSDLLEQVLGEAHAVGERAMKDQQASVSMMFDLAPKQQPCVTRVHEQWGYNSKYETYYVLLYHDRKDADPRSIDKNFRLGPP